MDVILEYSNLIYSRLINAQNIAFVPPFLLTGKDIRKLNFAS